MIVRIALAVLLLFTATTGLSQNYPMPGRAGDSPALCAACAGTNSEGVPNLGLPTWPYSSPLLDHAGRVVDSYDTINVQNWGIRTVRAREVRLSPNGNRLYLALGEAVGAYTPDTFFGGKLGSPLQPVTVLLTGNPYGGRDPFETIVPPDSFFYPESDRHASGWDTFLVDSQQNLGDFDADDRGYFYGASRHFGWGIHRDDRTDGRHMPFQSQTKGVQANRLFTFHIGSTYYAVVSDYQFGGAYLYDVTEPRTPARLLTLAGDAWEIIEWSRHDASQRIATRASDGLVRIYSFETLARGGEPDHTFTPAGGTLYNDVSFDENGMLWVAQAATRSRVTSNVLWQIAPDGTRTAFDVYGSPFSANLIHAAAGYIVVAGIGESTGVKAREIRLLKVDGAELKLLDTDHFFTRYYHRSPTGYARPEKNVDQVDVFLIAHGGRTYLIYNANGLGDIYELDPNDTLPSVESISPLTGPPAGGTSVTITGTNFTAGAVVTFGDTPASSVVVSDTTITATAPAHAPGEVNVTVTIGTRSVSAPQPFTYVLPTPTGLVANGTGLTTVTSSWNASEGAAQYEVQRRQQDGSWMALGRTAATSYDDGTCGVNAACLYRVRAVDAYEHTSGFCEADLGTTVHFEAPVIVPGMTVRLQHVVDLQTAVNVLRNAASLGPATFDSSLSGGTVIHAADVVALRALVNESRTALGLPAMQFTDPELLGQVIRAVHLQELVDAAK